MSYVNNKTGEVISDDNPYASIMAKGVSPDNPYSEFTMKVDEEIETKVQRNLEEHAAHADDPDWEYKDYELLTRQFVDGTVLNFADEIGASWGAVAAKVMAPDLTKGKSVYEIRQEMLDNLNAEGANFRKKRPVASAVAGLAGAIISPVSLKGGQLLSAGANVRKTEAARAAATTARGGATAAGPATLAAGSQLGIQTAEQAAAKTAQMYSGMSPAVYNIASKTPIVGQAMGLGALEGALAGAGASSETGMGVLPDAAIGAAAGAAVPLALKGIGTAFTGATRKRLAQDLGEGQDFVSLMFADTPEGLPLASMYKHVVAKAFGGRTLMEQQARRMASRISSSQRLGKVKDELVASAKLSLSTAKAAIEGRTNEAKRGLATIKTNATAAARLNESLENADLDYSHQLKMLDFDEASNSEGLHLAAVAAKEADEKVNALEGMFRSDAFSLSFPSSAPKELTEGIDQMNPSEVLVHLDEVWKRHGFKVANSVNYSIDPAKVKADVSRITSTNKEAAALLGESGKLQAISTYVDSFLQNSLKYDPEPNLLNIGKGGGTLAGDQLINLRSGIGILINGLSESKDITRSLASNVQDYFDDILMAGLTKKQQATFLAEKRNWAIFKTAEDAVFSAKGRLGDIDGAFTGKDWISAIKSNSKWLSSRDAAYLQKEATARMRDSEDVRITLSDIAAKRIKDAHSQARREKKLEGGVLKQQKQALAKQLNADLKRLRDEHENGRKTVETASIYAKKREELITQMRLSRENIDDKIESVKQQELWFLQNKPRGESSSMFEQLFATGVIGSVIETIVSAPIKEGIGQTLGTGFVGANILARESFQRALVGQTGWQARGRALGESVENVSQRLLDKGISPVSGGASVESAGDREKPLFSSEIKASIKRMDKRRRNMLFKGLVERGTAAKLKREDPEFYNQLKADHDDR